MKNRKSLIPILNAVVLLLAIHSRAGAQTSTEQPEVTAPAEAGATTTPATTPTPEATAKPLPAHTADYTVVKGDTLTSLANKFNTTRRKLKELNDLAGYKITPGQVILVPSYKKHTKSVAESTHAKTRPHHTYAAAQPVQDFDIPASTFASCPVPVPDEDADSSTPETKEKAAPIAQLVSPAEMAADQAARRRAEEKAAIDKAAASAAAQAASARTVTSIASAPAVEPAPRHFAAVTSSSSRESLAPAPSGWANPSNAPRPVSHGFFSFFHSTPSASASASDWGARFLQEARALGDQGISYDDEWRPPGESHSWEMDCSNTSRYLYKVTTGILLPRTASDQYYYLHLQGKAWDVPTTANGWADGEYLRRNLKPGDLLFWENTYRPERQPPITHVMVFLGTNPQGQWIMAGSQSSRGGEHNRRHGGPDIYVFRPSQPCGGYSTWLGMVHHTGRFCAFGRPLEADPSKFALND